MQNTIHWLNIISVVGYELIANTTFWEAIRQGPMMNNFSVNCPRFDFASGVSYLHEHVNHVIDISIPIVRIQIDIGLFVIPVTWD
jgi:hypothetical protein